MNGKRNRTPAEAARQTLRDTVRALYGDTLPDKISNLTIPRMKELIAARSVSSVGSGRSEQDIIAEWVEYNLVEPPPREPVLPETVVMPDGRWALPDDAAALNELADQAHDVALHANARAAFEPYP